MADKEPQHIIGGPKSWPMAAKPGERGPMVMVEIGHGRFVRMYRDDAIAQGLITCAGATSTGEPKDGKGEDGEDGERADSGGR